jgi:hypothetical protein
MPITVIPIDERRFNSARRVILAPMLAQLRHHPAVVAFIVVMALLLLAVLPTLQTIPNGSEHYYMIDVGETQIVLNVWGTLHATGYPLYVILSSALAALLKLLGMGAAAAPAVTSLLWGMAALGVLYALALRLTGRVVLAAAVILLLGLTRTVWIHLAIAEIYSFGLLISAALLAVALWNKPIPHRVYLLALLGGIGVAHHRAIAMMIPALLYAALPNLSAQGRRLPRVLLICLLLGLLGFVQYAYLPLRANAGAAWVYGDPSTLVGLWDQFTGREAERFIGAPSTLDGLWTNISMINGVLLTDVGAVGLVAGIVGLLVGIATARHRRLAITMLLYGGAAYLFHALFYTDILSALILPVLVSMAFGWLLLGDRILSLSLDVQNVQRHPRRKSSKEVLSTDDPRPKSVFRHFRTPLARRFERLAFMTLIILFALTLYTTHQPFIAALTSDRTGIDTIALARGAPPDSALMLAWGPRYFAVGFARDVLGELPGVTLVDHKADFAALAAEMPIVTPEYTFYRQPPAWWTEALGQPVYLRAVAPSLVEIGTAPMRAARGYGAFDAYNPVVTCDATRITLAVDWYTPDVPPQDLSVFVHLRDAADTVIAQGDQAAPVYGWRPLTTWTVSEIVHDVYLLPYDANGTAIVYGLYTQRADGSFENVVEYRLDRVCE